MKAIRADILIAVCALLISGFATGASWWQTRVIAAQLTAQVWPYVSITNSLNVDSVDVSLSNDGLGPAVIRSIVVTVDGKPQRDVAVALSNIIGTVTLDKNEKVGWDSGTIGAGGVIRVGGSQTLVHVQSVHIARAAAAGFSRVNIRACYCAIVVGNCWRKDERNDDPIAVSSCPSEPNMLKDPTQAELKALLSRHLPQTG